MKIKLLRRHKQHDGELKRTKVDIWAERAVTFMGTLKFIVIFALVLVAWITLNTLQITEIIHFDSKPYQLLNLLLSCLASFQASIMLMGTRYSEKRLNKTINETHANLIKTHRETHELIKKTHGSLKLLFKMYNLLLAIAKHLGMKDVD